jgi:hypothetical protein
MKPLLLARNARMALLSALTLLCAAPLGSVHAQSRDEPLPGEYRVVDGRVDRGTYSGWRLFHSGCHSCHGVGGGGTDVAPNLVEKVANYTPKGFATKVLTSYRIVRMTPDTGVQDREAERDAMLEEVMKRERTARGQPVMPAWEEDDAVAPHVLDLYAYLSARADGQIGPGKPRMLDRKKR